VACSAVALRKRGLVGTQLRDGTDPVGVIDQPCAVLDHGVHRPPELQIAHVDQRRILRLSQRPNSCGRTPASPSTRPSRELTIFLGHVQHPHPSQSASPPPARYRRSPSGISSSSQPSNSRNDREIPDSCGGSPATCIPTQIRREEPFGPLTHATVRVAHDRVVGGDEPTDLARPCGSCGRRPP
jgi:hypothetical protein